VPKSEQTIFRAPHDKDHPFTQNINQIIRDTRLSLDARGLMIYFLSLPDDWVFVHKCIIRDCKINRRVLDRCLDELIAFGYVVRTREKAGNLLSAYKYKIYELPLEQMPSQDSMAECSKTTLEKNSKKIVDFPLGELPSQALSPSVHFSSVEKRTLTNDLSSNQDVTKTLRDGGNVHKSVKQTQSSFACAKIKQEDISSLSPSEGLIWLREIFRFKNGQAIQDASLFRWCKKHGSLYVIHQVFYLLKQEAKRKIPKPEAYLQRAVDSDYAGIQHNREFAKQEDLKQKQRLERNLNVS
jgi:hypothetical protein